MTYRWLCILLFFSIGLYSGTALALSPIDKEAAIEADFPTLIDQARVAFEESDFEAAVEYLVIANRLEDEPRLFLNIARSYEELGQCHLALVYYEAFLKSDSDEEALADRARKAIESGIPDCDEYDPNLGGRLLLESEPQLASVYVDGEFIGTTPTETAALTPGVAELRFEREGYEVHVQQFEIVADREMEVRAQLVEESDEPPAQDPPPPPPEADEGFSPNPVSLGLVGAGALSLGIGAYLDLVMLPQITEERDQASGDEAAALTRRRQNVAVGTVAAYVVGGIFLTGGVAWLAYDFWHYKSDDTDNSTAWRVVPVIDSTGASMTLFRRF